MEWILIPAYIALRFHDRCIPTGQWGRRKWKKVVQWAKQKGLEGAYAKQRKQAMPRYYWWAQELIFQRVKGALGLDRCRFMVTGAAPLSRHTQEFFMSLGMEIMEMYGMTETGGPATWNKPTDWCIGTVGKPMMGIEVMLAEDNEILLRGPNCFSGYYKQEEATRQTLDANRWVHTGDIGAIDTNGFLRITDRKKNLIITAGGENIAPTPIEAAVKKIAGVSECVVVGDRQKYLVALLTLEIETINTHAAEWGVEPHTQGKVDAGDEAAKALEAILSPRSAAASRGKSYAVKEWEKANRPNSADSASTASTVASGTTEDSAEGASAPTATAGKVAVAIPAPAVKYASGPSAAGGGSGAAVAPLELGGDPDRTAQDVYDDLARHEVFNKWLWSEIEAVNKPLARAHQIKKHVLPCQL